MYTNIWYIYIVYKYILYIYIVYKYILYIYIVYKYILYIYIVYKYILYIYIVYKYIVYKYILYMYINCVYLHCVRKHRHVPFFTPGHTYMYQVVTTLISPSYLLDNWSFLSTCMGLFRKLFILAMYCVDCSKYWAGFKLSRPLI
jgi:hypothetical protein